MTLTQVKERLFDRWLEKPEVKKEIAEFEKQDRARLALLKQRKSEIIAARDSRVEAAYDRLRSRVEVRDEAEKRFKEAQAAWSAAFYAAQAESASVGEPSTEENIEIAKINIEVARLEKELSTTPDQERQAKAHGIDRELEELIKRNGMPRSAPRLDGSAEVTNKPASPTPAGRSFRPSI